MKNLPGRIRDSVIDALLELGGSASVLDVHSEVNRRYGPVPRSSVQSSLQLQARPGGPIRRLSRGVYAVGEASPTFNVQPIAEWDNERVFHWRQQRLILADCLEWLARQPANAYHAVVTDPPYGLREYEAEQQEKLRSGRGGIWRLPPAFDGATRMPLPRFTVLDPADRRSLREFFYTWASLLLPVVRPGGYVVIASNPLLSPLVAAAMEGAGFERRGEIVRLVRTFRGGDRPKGAHEEFPDVSTMPRSCWEPWGLYRKPIDQKTVSANLRVWGTGALRRPSRDTPFADVIESGVTPARERAIAAHPSLKPQDFMRQLVRAVLPTGEGRILDTFAGCASTLAACQALAIEGVGVEIDEQYWLAAQAAIPMLAALETTSQTRLDDLSSRDEGSTLPSKGRAGSRGDRDSSR
ncbi:MAG: hypothetical protein AMXMBFR23_11980 [Chloroflexota bacterium]